SVRSYNNHVGVPLIDHAWSDTLPD
ncbi:MAG: hypothetical protein RLZZ584_2890, partial [Pseudomonadota bacterium]